MAAMMRRVIALAGFLGACDFDERAIRLDALPGLDEGPPDDEDVAPPTDIDDVDEVARNASEVAIDLGPLDGGSASCADRAPMCPCSSGNPGGYCRPGEACAAGRCTAGAVAGSLVITEIMTDPMAVSDEVGEWFEVFNPGASPIDLRGVRIGNNRGQSMTVTSADPLVVSPMSYAVLARSANPAMNGGVAARYGYAATVSAGFLSFSNASTDVLILDLGASATEIDRVEFDATAASGWPHMPGQAKALRAASMSATANDPPSSWCDAPTRWSGSTGDYGSPGVANPMCP